MTDKKVKKHIKMYASDEHIELVKEQAEAEGVSHSNYLFSLTKKDLKRNKK